MTMWKKIKEFITHPQILVALALGIGIIAQAYFYKKVYLIPVEGTAILIPGLVVLVYEVLIHKKEDKYKKYLKPIYWVSAVMLANIISILVPLLDR